MKISIITITFNSEETIEDTIKSVLSQSFDEWEYIVIDGLSSDNTIKIVKAYADGKFRIISEKDCGISDAFNKGIALADGEIISIINSDDLLMPEALEKVSKIFLENRDIDIVYGNSIRFVNDINDGYEVKACTQLEQMKYNFLLLHPSVFIRKKAYEKYGVFKCTYKNAMDYELISRMYFAGAKFKYVDEILSAFREGGISQSKFNQTMKEHREIAKINGGTAFEINYYIFKLYMRKYILIILKKIGMESFFRRHLKKQHYYIGKE